MNAVIVLFLLTVSLWVPVGVLVMWPAFRRTDHQ
jgi:hypothetical protein